MVQSEIVKNHSYDEHKIKEPQIAALLFCLNTRL